MSKLQSGDAVSSTTSLVVDPIIFTSSTLEEWGFGKDEHVRAGFAHPVPKTWIRPQGVASSYKGILCCPNCRNIKLIDDRVHDIEPNGYLVTKAGGDFHCQCGLHRKVFLDRWLKKPLYACVIERILPGLDSNGFARIKRDIVYVSADNQAEAKFHCGPGNYRFVEVAPAIGFFTRDADGKDNTLVGDSRGFASEQKKISNIASNKS